MNVLGFQIPSILSSTCNYLSFWQMTWSMRRDLTVVLISIFQITTNVEHLSTCLLAHLRIFFGELSTQFLRPFLVGLFVFLLFKCQRSLHILDSRLLSDIWRIAAADAPPPFLDLRFYPFPLLEGLTMWSLFPAGELGLPYSMAAGFPKCKRRRHQGKALARNWSCISLITVDCLE